MPHINPTSAGFGTLCWPSQGTPLDSNHPATLCHSSPTGFSSHPRSPKLYSSMAFESSSSQRLPLQDSFSPVPQTCLNSGCSTTHACEPCSKLIKLTPVGYSPPPPRHSDSPPRAQVLSPSQPPTSPRTGPLKMADKGPYGQSYGFSNSHIWM